MKRLLSAFLTICLSVMIAAALADAQDLKWGMTKQEVYSLLGSEAMESDLGGQISAEYEAIIIGKERFSKFEDAVLACFFINDRMFSKMYSVSDSSTAESYDYLLKALENKYGASGHDYEVSYRFFDLLGMNLTQSDVEQLETAGVITFVTWETEEKEDICLIILNTAENPRSYAVYFMPADGLPEAEYDDFGI